MRLFDIWHPGFWPARKGMKSLHQHLENQNCEAERIVIRCAGDPSEILAL